MNKRLHDVLNGREENYLLPFYWLVGRNTDKLREQIAMIESCGIKAICIESRTHTDFGGDGWWEDLAIIFDECKKRDMKVWILDDDHFPTGHAGGLLQKKYPERRKWFMLERHVDVMGPMKEATVMLPRLDDGNILLGIYAYKREAHDEAIFGEPIDLTGNVKDGLLTWDVPDGCYRIFYILRSRLGGSPPQTYYISLIDPESCDVQIEGIYEPIYEHFSEYFGNTIAGFFSDEPQLGCGYYEGSAGHIEDMGVYNRTVGMPGMALCYTERLEEMMDEELGFKARAYVPAIWYAHDKAKALRYTYMNVVSKLYRDSFTKKLGKWCSDRGVMYIGHVIEDSNCHARLGCGTAHFFRSLTGQHMSGMDIVLHQVMPGFGHQITASVTAGGRVDPDFNHYMLPKMCASLAHIDPEMQGRAMCETFGAFGWAEGVPFMKWLMDFLFVRGINYFVPHAFSQTFPNSDCPPHFGACGEDPQFEGFKHLMRYSNKMSHLLTGAKHIADAAILYHGEAEWINGKCMFTEAPAKVLYDDKIDYDILPIDALSGADIKSGRLCINGEDYGVLIIPAADTLPEAFVTAAKRLSNSGLPVWFVDEAPEGCESIGEIVGLCDIAAKMRREGLASVEVIGDSELLRIYHCNGDSDVYMFFNESLNRTTNASIKLPTVGKYAVLDLINGVNYASATDNGVIALTLEPYESRVVVFGENSFCEKYELAEYKTLDGEYTVSIADSADLAVFKPYKVTRELVNFNTEMPRFSGYIKYETEFVLDDKINVVLDLGVVGQCAEVSVNGSEPQLLICNPYRADISEYVKPGVNKLTVTVGNTLFNRMRDGMSFFMQVPPSGLMGPVRLFAKI